MATLDGNEIPQCVRCTLFKPDATERTVVKPSGKTQSVLCDDCAASTAEVYEVKSAGRQSAASDDAPPAAPSISKMSKAELLAEAAKRNLDVTDEWSVSDLRNALHVDDAES